MQLPYLDVPITERVFLNGERARTHFSNQNKIPGLFAATRNYSAFGGDPSATDAWVTPGIAEISRKSVTQNDLVSPLAAFPLFLHPETRNYAIVWYATMLQATRSQGMIGSVQAIKITGKMKFLSLKIIGSSREIAVFPSQKLARLRQLKISLQINIQAF